MKNLVKNLRRINKYLGLEGGYKDFDIVAYSNSVTAKIKEMVWEDIFHKIKYCYQLILDFINNDDYYRFMQNSLFPKIPFGVWKRGPTT